MMHRPLLICCAALLLATVSPAISRAEDDATIRTIRQQCEAIDAGARRYTRKERDLPGESTEGGTLVGYYQSGRLRKLVASYYGESGRDVEEYYLVSGHLVFILRTSFDYKAPITSNLPGAGAIAKITRERYYFQGGHLVHWMGSDGKSRALTTPEAKKAAQEQRSDVARFTRLLAKPPVKE